MRGEQDLSWTVERVALLLELWRQGISASAIGVQLGLSRCAILGKVQRLRRLASNVRPSKTRQSDTALPKSAASDTQPLHGSPPPAPRRRGKRGDRSESPHAKAKARGKGLLDLTNNSCRWPLGKPGAATKRPGRGDGNSCFCTTIETNSNQIIAPRPRPSMRVAVNIAELPALLRKWL